MTGTIKRPLSSLFRPARFPLAVSRFVVGFTTRPSPGLLPCLGRRFPRAQSKRLLAAAPATCARLLARFICMGTRALFLLLRFIIVSFFRVAPGTRIISARVCVCQCVN